MQRNLNLFQAGNQKAPLIKTILWWVTQNTVFNFFGSPNLLRILCLKTFGAKIGSNVIIKFGVKVHFPWNLTIGNATWVGERVWIINHAPFVIGSIVCISQDSILSSGSHDMYSPALQYKHAPIEVEDGAWLCLRSTVLAGVKIGRNSVVSAGEVIRVSLPDESLYLRDLIIPIQYDRSRE